MYDVLIGIEGYVNLINYFYLPKRDLEGFN